MDKNVWVDFENAPHVWILKEIIEKLKKENFKITITARNFSSTLNLCQYLKIPYENVSVSRTFQNKYGKLFNTIFRALKLKKYISLTNKKPDLAISHGSRSQGLSAFLMGIPVLSLDDYEYSSKFFNYFVNKLLTPDKIPAKEWGRFEEKVISYPGLKEELYLCNQKNYKNEKFDFLSNEKINIVFRPEGRFAHYSSVKSKNLQNIILEHFASFKNIFIILIARDKLQEKEIENYFKKKGINYIIPKNILNGPALIYNSDLVVGGGGTMTRESSILNIPSYTFFGGKLGHVDKYLLEQKKLVLIESENDILKIKITKRNINRVEINKDAFDFVYNFIQLWLN